MEGENEVLHIGKRPSQVKQPNKQCENRKVEEDDEMVVCQEVVLEQAGF